MKTAPVLILGTGALGTLFGARLASAGVPVLMLGTWQAALAALNTRGARLSSADGRILTGVLKAVDDPWQCRQIHYALVLVKSWQTARAARQLAACLPVDGLALTLQNGLGNDQLLAEVLGAERVAVGVTTTGAALLSPGLVQDGGSGQIDLDEHPRLEPLARLLEQAGFPVHIYADVRGLQWGKLAVNSAINPLTALENVPNGDLLRRPRLRRWLQMTALETGNVAEALGIHLPFDDPAEAAQETARRTARNFSSMLQDLRRGAPTEIEAINGAVVRAAQAANLPAPRNRALLCQVRRRVRLAQTADTRHAQSHLIIKA
jgi:2-dehydropantoate 2-reductase